MFIPTANSAARTNAVRPNSAPTATIIADIPTNSTKVFSLLACGCQVICVCPPRNTVSCGIPLSQRPGRPSGFHSALAAALAVSADRVVDQCLQCAPPGNVGQ